MSDEDISKAKKGSDSDNDSCQSDETRGTSNVQFSCAKSLAPIEDEEPLQPYYATTISSGGTVMTDDLSSLGQRGIEDYSVASSRYPTSSLGGYRRREIQETVLEEDEDAYESSVDGRSKDSKQSKSSKSSRGSQKSSKSSRSSKSNESGKSKSSKGKRSRTKKTAPQEDATFLSDMSLDVSDLSPPRKQYSRIKGSNTMSGSSGSGGKNSFNHQADVRGNDEEPRRARSSGPHRPPPLTSFQRPSLRSQGSVSTMSSFGLSTATPSSAGSSSRYASMRSIGSDHQSQFSSDTNSMFFGSAATTSISEGPSTSIEEMDDLGKTFDDRSASTAKTNQNFFDGVPDTVSTGSSKNTRRKDSSIYPLAGAGDAPSVSSMQSNRDFFAGGQTTGGGSTTQGGTLEGTINSTRSAGWSQYDDADQDLSTLGTNQEFFERALPYQPGDGLSKLESKKSQDRSSTPGSNTFRSEASVGWDDETMSTLDTKKKFFEKMLPWSVPAEPAQDGASASPGFDQRTATPSSTIQNNTAYYEVDGTILTEGTGFWDANKPKKGFDEEVAMDTIQEDTPLDSGSDTRSVSYTVSSRSSSRASSKRSQHSYEAGKYSIYSGSSRASPAIRSTSSRDSSSVGSGIDRPTGVFIRPSHRQNTDPRKSISQEVEVSMDGFLHQSKAPLDDETVASSYEGMTEYHGEFDKAPWDRSNGAFHRIMTLCSLSALVATALFFAVHIGPFYVQPPTSGRATSQSSQLATEGNKTVSQSELTWEREVENFPHNIQRAYMDWRTPYGGPSKELPTLWSYEKSGSEIVENVFGHCLSRTQAGNGLTFDTEGSAVQAWSDEVGARRDFEDARINVCTYNRTLSLTHYNRNSRLCTCKDKNSSTSISRQGLGLTELLV
jgi:hypothetical protein